MSFSADDDSDTSPHDLEGGDIDLEYGPMGGSGYSLGSHFNIGQHSFSQMQVCLYKKLQCSK